MPHLFYISEEQVGVDSQINIYFFGYRPGWILWVDVGGVVHNGGGDFGWEWVALECFWL